MRKLKASLSLMFILVSSSCAAKPGKIQISVGGIKIEVEVADSDAERTKGLMYRKSVPEGTGMLFVFERDEKLSFWMKNTEVALSIAYITSEGKLSEILDMEPLSLAPVRSDSYVRYALEVPRGWFAKAGIKPGDMLELPKGFGS